MARLLIVSNRLPVTVTRDEQGELRVQRSAGGLATGLSGRHERSERLWIGWPGDSGLDDAARAALEARLAELRAVPVWLEADDVRRFHEGFSNGVLWPLFHYLLDQIPLHVHDWDAYERANERFTDAVAAVHQPGDVVWVRDYHLSRLRGVSHPAAAPSIVSRRARS